MASSKCAPLLKHAATSYSGAQLLYNYLACLKGILSKKIENFPLAKICIPEKSLI